MNRKRNIIIIISILIISLIVIILAESTHSDDIYEETNTNKKTIEKFSPIAMMLETSAGSGKYEASTANGWPETGYKFNSTLSKCVNGGKLSWDSTTKKVIMISDSQDKCYAYFDVYVPPRFDETCDETTLACHVAKLYTGTQGENGIYYHDSSLTDGAGDNSYRYAGAFDEVNNYACIGTQCSSDNSFRIIGVFDGKLKIIFSDYATDVLGTEGTYYGTYENLGVDDSGTSKSSLDFSAIATYAWNSAYINGWYNDSLLPVFFTTNLNTYFLNNVIGYRDIIENNIWQVGGINGTSFDSAKQVYGAEITNSNITYKAQIGLMYISDYVFAGAPSLWQDAVSYYNNPVANWMYMGLREWAMTPDNSTATNAILINQNGSVGSGDIAGYLAVRPVMYLKSNVKALSGEGTNTSPYLIEY